MIFHTKAGKNNPMLSQFSAYVDPRLARFLPSAAIGRGRKTRNSERKSLLKFRGNFPIGQRLPTMPLSLQYGSPAEKVESEKEISNPLDRSSDPIKLCHILIFSFLLSIFHRDFLSFLPPPIFFFHIHDGVKQTALLSRWKS